MLGGDVKVMNAIDSDVPLESVHGFVTAVTLLVASTLPLIVCTYLSG